MTHHLLLRLCGTLLCLMAVLRSTAMPTDSIVLRSWQFSAADTLCWRSATVPGTIHADLLRHGIIPDPYTGTNEAAVQWVEECDWVYRTQFEVSRRQWRMAQARLELDGLDTFADIFLNGQKIGRSNNMFVGWQQDVKSQLRQGINTLTIVFRSPLKEKRPAIRRDGFSYPADNDHATDRVSVYCRKAPYSFGWDWGIRLAGCGLWREARLVFYPEVRIADAWWRTIQADTACAKLQESITLHTEAAQEGVYRRITTCTFQGSEVARWEDTLHLAPGSRTLHTLRLVPKPHLWQPNGWGSPHLYDWHVELRREHRLVARHDARVGIRTVEVALQPDSMGRALTVRVNGHPLFVKGANYIPQDGMLCRVDADRHARLMRMVKAQHINMLRVWGGGVYEDEEFYRQADENGILIWQDFMFACTTYPSDSAFLDNVRQEALYNVRRLRRHAALALWTGNNEIWEGMRYWGWKRKYTPQVWEEMVQGYSRLFETLLPEVVASEDPGRFYMHSSPLTSNWGIASSWADADTHNWGIWYGKKDFETLDSEVPRFMSEYGFQAYPEMKTLRTFAREEDMSAESAVMLAHQKASIGNALIGEKMARYLPEPKDFATLVYQSQVLQALAVGRGIAAHRRHRPYCMGTMYWQLNDSWPVVSWSAVDYYGNAKALHYEAARLYANTLLTAYQNGTQTEIYIACDSLHAPQGTMLAMQACDFSGKVLRRRTIPVQVPCNGTVCVDTIDSDTWFAAPEQTYLLLTLQQDGRTLQENVWYPAYPKAQQIGKAHIDSRCEWEKGAVHLTLRADRVARMVFVETPWQGAEYSDNFFDLLPGKEKRITIRSPEIQPGMQTDIHIRQLNNYENK